MQIGVAIVGTGKIAIANHVPGLKLCSQARLVALCDADENSLERAKTETGVTVAYKDHRAVMRDQRVNAVIVATPNFTHREIVLAALAAGKHVLCEKPLALDLAGA